MTRFTPAYAGNTYGGLIPSTPAKVHPRIRGEYPNRLIPTNSLGGSPPHTRGILDHLALRAPLSRFTPAYAGNTRQGSTLAGSRQVHPRIRGEYAC